ncbi:hypothetical protein ASG01_05240 [Chryseobacterium sp. Leaf180]|jgi:negative regulator of sigma E activity|uniref:hypothetical protein n=1 Tax=Chryseobacterium sp. Leaf180 TaxID=1736289 RepID=UPI0006FE6815|nr:hypothetical protein [Chryseobacterium sp. Leaf180]KQR95254.1 hypothetical protein ASG01_05240 [Chryseobacterium sp. Leaf180]
MKDFDIENLERKNIYHLPENTFEKMQAGVFAQMKPVKKAPVFKLSWALAAAASLALIFGVTFIFNNGNETQKNIQSVAVKTDQNTKTQSTETYQTLQSDVAEAEQNQTGANVDRQSYPQTASNTRRNNNQNAVQVSGKSAEQEMTEYLDSFSSSDIAEVSKNSSQDVYLDLYN